MVRQGFLVLPEFSRIVRQLVPSPDCDVVRLAVPSPQASQSDPVRQHVVQVRFQPATPPGLLPEGEVVLLGWDVHAVLHRVPFQVPDLRLSGNAGAVAHGVQVAHDQQPAAGGVVLGLVQTLQRGLQAPQPGERFSPRGVGGFIRPALRVQEQQRIPGASGPHVQQRAGPHALSSGLQVDPLRKDGLIEEAAPPSDQQLYFRLFFAAGSRAARVRQPEVVVAELFLDHVADSAFVLDFAKGDDVGHLLVRANALQVPGDPHRPGSLAPEILDVPEGDRELDVSTHVVRPPNNHWPGRRRA